MKKENHNSNKFFKSGKLLNLVICLLATIFGYSQTSPKYYNANNSTSSNTFPLGGATNRVQWVYGPNLFKTGGTTGTASGNGTITRIYFRLGSSANGTNTNTDYTVSLSQNVGTMTAFTSSTWITGLTTCFYRATYQMTGATTNSWYGITLQTPFSYDASKSLIFELKVSSSVGGNYVAQSSSAGRIWGTYASAPNGTSYGTGLVDFGFDLMKGSNDAGITSLVTPLCAPTLTGVYSNSGINAIDSVKINWSVNGSLQKQINYTKPLASAQNVNITFTPDFNFVDGDYYTVKAWTSLPNNKQDTVNKNDTSQIYFQFMGPAGTPTVSDVIKCGPGRAPLSAKTVYNTDSVVWFDAATAGNIIAYGKNALSPPLVLGSNTYYAQAFKISTPQKLSNGMSGNSYYSASNYTGGMFDVVPKNDVVIDSFSVHLVNLNVGQTFNVYMKSGSYSGYETNSGAWTLIANNVTARVLNVGSKNIAYVPIPQTSVLKGNTYGFYVTTTGVSNSCYMTSGSFNIADNEMTVSSNRVLYGASPFSSYGTYYIGLEVHYRKFSCPSSRVPCVVTVKPSPHGASFIKGSLFQTTMPYTNGTKGNPDIVAKGDKLSYEITPPTGYNNTDYGTTWIMSNVTLKTPKGTIIPSTFYTPSAPSPTGSSNALITFMPDASLTDSTIIMTIQMNDLGPYYCDSTITRYIFVAPRPQTDFKFPQPVCDGDNVIFTNTSKVSSGNLLSKWNFGTGNSADTSNNTDAVFTYPTHGVYLVKLITSTVPYYYKDSITLSIEVTEIPKIGFKVYNACMGDSVSFVNSTTISKGKITYHWDLGNGNSSVKVNPKQKYASSGSYKVTLTATSNGCSQVLSKNAWEFARPVAKFSLPTTLCDKTELQFKNLSTIASGNMGYNWSFSDGGKSTLTNAVHQFSNSGNKTVKLKAVSEFGCADSSVQTISLNESPFANFTFGPVCNQSNTQFTFTGTKPASPVITVFNWDFGGFGTTTIENPAKTFSVIGKKIITLTLNSNNGCSDVITKEIDVKLQSKADFTTADVCQGQYAVFTNNSTVSSGNLLYNWKFGDGKTSNIQSPRHVYTDLVSKTYNVTLTAIVPGGCSDSITKSVSVNTNPDASFTYNMSGRLVYFKANLAGGTSYHWDFGDGGSSETQSAQYHYLNYPSGKYLACLTVKNSADCFDQTCQMISINGSVSKINKNSRTYISPNPNNGNFTITIENPKDGLSIIVYDILGNEIKNIETNKLKTSYEINLNVSQGIYYVKINNGGSTYTHKINVNN
ncbi:MAG: PKD domain-containing protein [Bacteroidetes bacterium]|nr:PKD domain-containing protein [Bacteroidota bacterium]